MNTRADIANVNEDTVIRYLLEGTAGQTGPDFFAALMKHLSNWPWGWRVPG
jgi:hypothetical protein